MVDISDEVFQKMIEAGDNYKHIPISAFQPKDEVLIDAESGSREIWTVTGCMVSKRKQNYITAYRRENGEIKEGVFLQEDIICKMGKNQLLFPFM